MTCALCELAIRTRVYHEDDICIVLDCKDCHIPMIVLRRHRAEASSAEVAHMEAVLAKLGMFVVSRNPRKIPEHIHWHARFINESDDKA